MGALALAAALSLGSLPAVATTDAPADPSPTSVSEPTAPVTSEPPTSEPPTTEPPTTEPPTTDPTPTEPAPSEPAPSEPAPSEPPTTEPPATEPPTTDPGLDPTSPAPTTPTPTTEEPTAPAPTIPPPLPPAGPDEAREGTASDILPHYSGNTTAWPDLSLLPADGVVSSLWSNPLRGRLVSGFGMRIHPVLQKAGLHTGVDIAAPCGTPIVASAEGVVAFVGTNFQWRTGNQVVIAHGDGVVTRYGHVLSGTTTVELGDRVVAGQHIGDVGGNRAIDPVGAGNSTGCHLHYEVNFDNGGRPVDPVGFYTQIGVNLGSDMPVTPEEGAAASAGKSMLDIDTMLAVVTEIVDVVPGVVPEFQILPRD